MHPELDQWNTLKKTLNTAAKQPYFNEAEVWWCSIGINVGFEVYRKGKLFSRPVLILKKTSKNTFFGIPLTSRQRKAPYRKPITFQNTEGDLLLEQIRLMDSKRLSAKMGQIGKNRFQDVRLSVQNMFSDFPSPINT